MSATAIVTETAKTRRIKKTAFLTWFERFSVCLVGFSLIAAAAWLLFHPSKREKTETVTASTPTTPSTKTTIEEAEHTNVVIVLLVAGLIFGAFGINRARITSLKFGDLAAGSDDTEAPLERLTEESEKAVKVLEEAEDDDADTADLQPTKTPAETITLEGKKYPVYRVDAVPVEVFRDLFVNWPEQVAKLPKDLSQFVYAIKKRGQGNHPWIIKFSDRPPLSFRKGKGGVKVKSLDEEKNKA